MSRICKECGMHVNRFNEFKYWKRFMNSRLEKILGKRNKLKRPRQ